MRKFFEKITKISKAIFNILVKMLTFIFYFLFITPYGIFIRLFKDYLDIKKEPCWESCKKIESIDYFLKG